MKTQPNKYIRRTQARQHNTRHDIDICGQFTVHTHIEKPRVMTIVDTQAFATHTEKKNRIEKEKIYKIKSSGSEREE